MLKMTRLAVSAAVLLIAAASAVLPQMALAQPQPPAPAAAPAPAATAPAPAPTARQGAEKLKEDSPYRFIAESGLEATTKHTGLLGNVDLNTWISMSIQRAIDNVQSRTQDGLAFLATVGSTAPFVGLFGTVWGI